MLDSDAARAIDDLANNFQNEFNKFLDTYRKSTEGVVQVLANIIEEQETIKEEIERQGAAINLQDKALAHVATRLDALEGIVGSGNTAPEEVEG